MARRTKAETFDIEVEAALEAALGFNFDAAAEAEVQGTGAQVKKSAEASETKQNRSAGFAALVAADADGKTPNFSEAFFSFRDLNDESGEDRREMPAPLDDDIFDLKNLEQQLASAAKELNKGRAAAESKKTAEKLKEFDASLPAEPVETVSASADVSADNERKRKYIIVGGVLSPREGRNMSEEGAANDGSRDIAQKADEVEIARVEAANEEEARLSRSEKDESNAPRDALQPDEEREERDLANFLQEQDFQARGSEAPADRENAEREPAAPVPFGAFSADSFSQNRNGSSFNPSQPSGNYGAPPSGGEPPAPSRKQSFKASVLRSPLYWTAAAVSALWAGGGIAAGYRLAAESGSSLGSFLASAQGLLAAAGTLVPIFMFWGFAQLAHRAKELHNIVRTMTGAAMRLLEPESASKDRVSSLGHTIRREVEAMDAGIDRTMSRASELEALLQSEVNNLERSYGENEVRIRALIAELANEREAVATHADNVKTKITGAKDQLTQEFSSIADHINATAESFTIALSETLNSRWGELVNEFNNANEEVARQLSQKFIDTVQSFDASRGQFFEELDTRFSQIDAHTDEASKAVAERLGSKMDDFVKIVQERTEAVEGRFDLLSGRLADSGNKVIDSVNGSVNEIEQRTQDIEERLQSTSDKVLGDFDEKFRRLDDAIIDRSNRSLSDFSEQIDRLEGRSQDFPLLFDEAAKTASDAFNKHMDTAEERYRSLADKFNKNGVELADSVLRNMQEAAKRSDEMDARLNMSSKAVMDVFENKLNALDNLFVDRSNHSLGLYAEQVRKLEDKSQDLSADFDSATQIAVRHFEERLDTVDKLLSHKSTSLIRSFIEKTESLEESTEKLNTSLEVHVERVNEAFRSRASDITDSLTNGRNDILSIVDETKTRLSHEMEIVGTTIGKLVDERAGGFIYQFIEGREKLSRTLQDETGRIIGTVGEQIERLAAYVGDIEKNLLSRVAEVETHSRGHIAQLDNKTAEFEKTITGSFALTQEMIERQAQNIDVRAAGLRDSLSLNSKELNAVLGEQAAELEQRIAAIRRVVAESDASFTEAMQNHVAAFGKSVSAGDAELRDIFLTHLQNLEAQTGRLKDGFNDSHATLERALSGKISALQSVFTEGRDSIETLLDRHGNIVTGRAAELQENLEQSFASIDEKLSKQSEILDKRAYDLRDAVDYNSTVLSDSFLRQTAIIDERTKTMQKALELGVGNVRSALEENADSLSELLRERLADVSNALGEERQKAEGTIANATGRLLSSVFDAADNLDQKLGSRSVEISNSINQAGVKLDEDMGAAEARLADIAASLGVEADKAGARIVSAGDRLSDTIIHASEQADKVFADRSSALQDNLGMVESRLDYGLQSIQEQMLGTTGQIEQRLGDKAQLFKDDLQKMGDGIGGSVDTIRERIGELTHNAAQELVEKTESLHGLTEQLKNAATRTSDSLAALTGTFSKQLHEVTQAAEERLRQENENFVTAFSGRTEDAVFAVQNAKNELENQISRLLEGLENSGSSIQLTMSNLHDNVSEVDKQLSRLTSDFKQNIGEASENFTASGDALNRDLLMFQGRSREALDNVAKFSEQFNAHANLLSETTSILENSNRIFGDKMSGNEESLNRLAQGLIAKSDEIGEAMRNSEQLITSVIKNMEDKTWSSATELRSSLSALIHEAAGRFEGATEEIRKAADDIREELTRTKADLNRGMRSLPTQTKEYTDAMRKAVMDQIEALKDLSGIVEESGLLFDVSKPRNALKSQDMRGTSAARPAPQAPAFSPAAPESGFNKPSASYMPPRSAAYESAVPHSEAGSANGQSRGWVSDLLARAGKDEAQRTAPAGASSTLSGAQGTDRSATLNSMSADIVQAIDRDGIARLWQHYRRGQRNIAPDRLYTPEGYRIFEDIKHKYAYDGEFRRAVGQYISDFEHLLGDVTKNGGNNGTVRDYLTSDTGKVYTMLAHVSGRIQ